MHLLILLLLGQDYIFSLALGSHLSFLLYFDCYLLFPLLTHSPILPKRHLPTLSYHLSPAILPSSWISIQIPVVVVVVRMYSVYLYVRSVVSLVLSATFRVQTIQLTLHAYTIHSPTLVALLACLATRQSIVMNCDDLGYGGGR